MGDGGSARRLLIHIEVAVRVRAIRRVVGPGGRPRADVEPGKVEVTREVPGIGPGAKTARRGAIQVSASVDVPAPGLGGDVGRGESG